MPYDSDRQCLVVLTEGELDILKDLAYNAGRGRNSRMSQEADLLYTKLLRVALLPPGVKVDLPEPPAIDVKSTVRSD